MVAEITAPSHGVGIELGKKIKKDGLGRKVIIRSCA